MWNNFFLKKEEKTKQKNLLASIPDLQKTVPGSCCNCHSIISNSQTANAVVMSSQHTWKKKTTFNEPVDQLINDGGCGESTLPVTNRRGRLLVCPTRCSWSRRIRPGEDGRSWRKQQRWCHIWCCHESTPLIPDPHADQTACRWRHQSLWQRHCHSGSTKKKRNDKREDGLC